jgi:type IV secretion system protein VirB5
MRKLFIATLALLGSVTLSIPAVAQIPVTDVGAIAQLIAQLQEMESQLEALESQLNTARSTLQSISGQRGLQNLLNGVVRNYLPTDWDQLQSVASNGGGSYGGLAAQLQAIISSNAVLSPTDLAALMPTQRTAVQQARTAAASLGVITRSALSNSSSRFQDIQQLISAIGAAPDQKSILELQARINGELGMLQNEQIKLQTLFQSATADSQLRSQRSLEQALADVGSMRQLAPLGL